MRFAQVIASPESLVGRRATSASGKTIQSGSSDRSRRKGSLDISNIKTPVDVAIPRTEDSPITRNIVDAAIRKTPRRMGWIKTAILMMAETMSLGIMSLPKAMNTLGLVFGTLLIVCFGVLSWMCGLLLWKVKLNNPQVVSYSDIMTKMYGKKGKVFATGNNVIMLIFVMAGHIITFTEMVRVLAGNDTPCLVLIKGVAAVVCGILSLPKLLRSNMPLYYIAAGSIITAAFIIMIDGGVADKQLGSKAAFVIVPLRFARFSVIASTVSNVMISYAGHMAYFQIMDEMENVKDFGKSLSLSGAVITIQYTLIAVVVYYFYGQDVESPALSSASPVVRKVAWIVAIPTIIIAGVIAAVVLNSETILLIWRKEQIMGEISQEEETLGKPDEKGLEEQAIPESAVVEISGPVPTISWKKQWIARCIINFTWWTLAFVLSNVIPGFSNLLALLGALSGWSIIIGQPALMWLWTDWRSSSDAVLAAGERRQWRQKVRETYLKSRGNKLWFLFCISMLILWPVAAVLGVYGSAILIKAARASDGVFACGNRT